MAFRYARVVAFNCTGCSASLNFAIGMLAKPQHDLRHHVEVEAYHNETSLIGLAVSAGYREPETTRRAFQRPQTARKVADSAPFARRTPSLCSDRASFARRAA